MNNYAQNDHPVTKDGNVFSFKGSQASTPRMKTSMPLARPMRQRNTDFNLVNDGEEAKD